LLLIEIICPFLFSIIGTSTLASTGETILLFTPSNNPTATTLAFAEPCYLGNLTDARLHARLTLLI